MMSKPIFNAKNPGSQLGLMVMNATLTAAGADEANFFQPRYFPPVLM